jgi:class 3 adenylate cyclase
LSHLQAEWQVPEIRHWYERLAAKRMLVRYDGRGTGLSELDVRDWSVDARLLDLEAIVDRLRLERFALFAYLHSGPLAITYAARHPERVSHLVLWCAYARGTDFSQSPQVQGTRAILDKDWHTFTETAAHALAMGWEGGELAHRLAVLYRESLTQDAMQAFVPAGNAIDLTDVLSQVKVPTLVLHRRQLQALSVDVARGLAARIPDARLALLEGTAILPFAGDMEAALEAIEEFLESRPADSAPEAPSAGGFATVLFTDVEGSTALTDRLGDAAARDVMREHERITREALKAHGGSEVKTMGDGFMASFGSATKALECAVAIQRAFDVGAGFKPVRPGVGDWSDAAIRVRIGLNAGEPIAEDDPDGRSDLFGTAVIVAARVAAEAHGGEILVSDVVRQLVAGKGFLFNDRGEHGLKGFENPVRVWEVRWRE